MNIFRNTGRFSQRTLWPLVVAIVGFLLPAIPVVADEPVAQSTRPAYVVVLNDASTIPATIIEVDRLPQDRQGAAQATMRQLTGRVAFPTVVINGEAVAGFSQSWIEQRIGR